MYTPAALTEPPVAPSCTDQTTPVSTDPVTEAVKVMVPPGATWEARGARLTTTLAGAGPVGPAAPVLEGADPQAAVAARLAARTIRIMEVFMAGVP
jgi:hypothetical protein